MFVVFFVLIFLFAGQNTITVSQTFALMKHQPIKDFSQFSGNVSELDPTENFSAIRELPVPQNFSDPLAITVDVHGNVWFAETNPPAIQKYVPSLSSFSLFPIPTSNKCGLIWSLIPDNDSNLWFSCASEPLLWAFSMSSHKFSNFSTGNAAVDPYSLVLDSRTNEIWFTSIYTDQIGAFQISSGSATLDRLVNVSGPPETLSTLGGPQYGPSGLAFDSAGNLFVSESFAAAIAEYNPNAQNLVKIWSLPAGAQPVGIAVNKTAGQIWFTNHASSLIGFVNESSDAVTEISTSLLLSGSSFVVTLPYWVQLSADGLVWFDEHIGNKIARFDPLTKELTEFFIPTSVSAPLGFAIDDARNAVWFTEFQANNLGELSENQTCTCLIALSRSELVLSGTSGQANFTVNYGITSPTAPSISGSLSTTGAVGSNLSISTRSMNSTAYEITLARGRNLTPGNYTLTICPAPSEKNLSMWVCPVASLTVLGGGSSTFALSDEDFALIGGIIIVVVGFVSLFYVRRWRFES